MSAPRAGTADSSDGCASASRSKVGLAESLLEAPLRPAARLAGLRPSPIRILSEGARPGTMPLGLGEPTWELPEPARRALAGLTGPCPYGPNAGMPGLRAVLAERHGTDPEQVLVTCGAQGALFALMMAWLEPGDAVLVPDPGFPAYPNLARLAGAQAVPYALGADYRLDGIALRAALDGHPEARMVVINHPSNPTGAGAGLEQLRTVARACEHRGVLLISDEVYLELHGGICPPSLREAARTGVVLGSLSKGWAAPGLRVGWALGDARWLQPARTVHAFAATAAPWPSQRAAMALLSASEEILAAGRREVALRWEALADAWRTHLGEDLARPEGGFYLWAPLPERAQGDPLAFCLRLRDEAGVVLVPGFAFGAQGRGFARLSFAARPEQIVEGVRRLAPWWRVS